MRQKPSKKVFLQLIHATLSWGNASMDKTKG